MWGNGMYYVYMIRCADNSLYTGITTNVPRRVSEHINQSESCAKYTRSHRAISLAASWEIGSRSEASIIERRIKNLPKAKKEALILGKIQLNELGFDKNAD